MRSKAIPETKATLRITEQLREIANFIEALNAANVDLLNKISTLTRQIKELQKGRK